MPVSFKFLISKDKCSHAHLFEQASGDGWGMEIGQIAKKGKKIYSKAFTQEVQACASQLMIIEE